MKAWWRWTFGTPTMDDLAATAVSRLQAAGAVDVQYQPEMGEIRYALGESRSVMALGNLLREVANTPRANRQAVVDRFISGVTQMPTAPSRYEDARPNLLPLLRTRMDVSLSRLTGQRGKAEPEVVNNELAHRPLAGGLIVALGFDTPDTIQRVTVHQLEEWGVDIDRALEDALANLRGLPEHGGWAPVGDGVWRGHWGDDHDAARLLLPDLIYRVGIRDPVAVAPVRNALLLADARDEQGLAALAHHTGTLMDDGGRWVSSQPLALVDGQWRVFEPPASVARGFTDLMKREQAEDHAEQKRLLDVIHEERNLDLFVASVTLARAGEGAPLFTYSVWSEDVDTLLPETDLVAVRTSADEVKMVAWRDVVAVAGHRMARTDDHPPRHRVSTFPTAEERARMPEGEPPAAA